MLPVTFSAYVRESGQGLRGLCPQSQPWRAVRFIEVEELCSERSSVPRPLGGAHQGRIFRRQATFLPMHSILRIDEVKKHGSAKITVLESGANVAQFPMPIISTPPARRSEARLGPCCRIPGPPALSAFRIAKLLDRLGALDPPSRGSRRASCTLPSSRNRCPRRTRGARRSC